MSTKPAPALAPQPELKEIPELTDAYRKAHKSYVLSSGLLASWELIGITLQTKEKWGIELKSPTAVPLILFVLVIYSGYKMTVEWMQCNPDRKKHPAAKWDYRIAHGTGLIAIAISAVQRLLRIQIVDILTRHPIIVIAGSLLLATIATNSAFTHLNRLSSVVTVQRSHVAIIATGGWGLILSAIMLISGFYKTSLIFFSIFFIATAAYLRIYYREQKTSEEIFPNSQ